MATLELEKCACTKKCNCEVSSDKAIVVNGLSYCSQACADGHLSSPSCPSVTCGCGAS